jgi:hypothetical protein
MDGKDYLPLAGVALGWGLTQLSTYLLRGRERRQRFADLRLATYAEWAAGIEGQFNAYATQQGSVQKHDVALCEKRLLLLEADPAIRALIQAVHDAFPALGSAEHGELEMIAHSDPEWEWPPFRDALNRLLERVRRDLATKA